MRYAGSKMVYKHPIDTIIYFYHKLIQLYTTMKIQNLQNAPKVPIELEAHILHSEKTVELVHLTLKPGEQLAEHKNPFDVIFFVVEGAGILTINGKPTKLKATDTLKVTSEINRGWENNTDNDLKILVIKLL